jgi:membrane-bound inhibitor of C-type lysozyme
MVACKGVAEQGVDRNFRPGALAILLGLTVAGCRARETVQRSPAATPPPAAQGQVNPDAGVTAYACVDGQTITAGYPDAQTAVVTYRGHAYTLKRASSAGSARYTGYGLKWQVRGAHATITALRPGEDSAGGVGLDCTAQAQPPASALTRASYGS